MKTKNQLYEEAVARNIKNAPFRVYFMLMYCRLSLKEAKTKLGIRADDTKYDVKVLMLLQAAQGQQENK